MTRLNHERVVRLLGVILEDGDYSLVMELLPKGNLLAMLDQVRGDHNKNNVNYINNNI